MNISKWAEISIRESKLAVFIAGGNRTISTDVNNTFTSNVNPTSLSLIYRWLCIDISSKTYWKDSSLRYIVFPNSQIMTIPLGSLKPNKAYNITLIAEDTVNHAFGQNTITVNAFSGSQLTVQIDSRLDKNGFIDYSNPILFVAISNVNNVGVNVNAATFTWSITNSLGVPVSLGSATQIMNSLSLPAYTFYKEEIFSVQVVVNYNNQTTNATSIFYTLSNSQITFDVQPTSGIAFTTDFIFSAETQDMDSDQTNFVFGYIKGNKKYYLTRYQPIPLYTLKLPQGESGNILQVFWKYTNNKRQTILSEIKQITVSAYSGGKLKSVIFRLFKFCFYDQ